MKAAIRKVGEKLVEWLAGGVALVLIAAITAAIGFLSGNRDIGLLIAAMLLIFGLGIWVGSRFAQRQLIATEKIRLEKSVVRGNLFVVGAFYGTGASWFEVTQTINAAIKEGTSKLDVNNNLVPSAEQARIIALPQRLIFAYVYQEHIYAVEAKQNDKLNLKSEGIEVVRAGGDAGQSNTTWKREKVPNIYWLGSDLMNTLCLISDDNPTHIIRNLMHINWHANKLELGYVPLWRLDKVLEQAKTYREWNAQERHDVAAELSELNGIIGNIMEMADPNYHPDEIEKLTRLIRSGS